MIRTSLLSVLLLAWLPWILVASEVEVRLSDRVLHFQSPPRLSDVLASIAEPEQVYWAGATLFRMDDALHTRQQKLLEDLQQLEALFIQRGRLSRAEEVRWLIEDLRQWQLGRRIRLNIDPELARWQLPFNPLLDPGAYELSYGQRPQSVYTSGLYHQTVLPFVPGMTARDYVDVRQFARLADPSHVWIIAAGGEAQKVGIRAWNYQPIQVMPGSFVLVLFQESLLPSAFKHVNEQLFELAQHRMPPL